MGVVSALTLFHKNLEQNQNDFSKQLKSGSFTVAELYPVLHEQFTQNNEYIVRRLSADILEIEENTQEIAELHYNTYQLECSDDNLIISSKFFTPVIHELLSYYAIANHEVYITWNHAKFPFLNPETIENYREKGHYHYSCINTPEHIIEFVKGTMLNFKAYHNYWSLTLFLSGSNIELHNHCSTIYEGEAYPEKELFGISINNLQPPLKVTQKANENKHNSYYFTNLIFNEAQEIFTNILEELISMETKLFFTTVSTKVLNYYDFKATINNAALDEVIDLTMNTESYINSSIITHTVVNKTDKSASLVGNYQSKKPASSFTISNDSILKGEIYLDKWYDEKLFEILQKTIASHFCPCCIHTEETPWTIYYQNEHDHEVLASYFCSFEGYEHWIEGFVKVEKQERTITSEKLYATWIANTDFLKNCIENKQYSDGIEFSNKIKSPELAFTSCRYPLYWALLYASVNNISKALDIIKMAYIYGFKEFWRFNPDSVGWSDKNSEEYLMLNPIHHNKSLQNFVKSVYTGKVEPWGFDLSETPLCWFEEVELTRKNQKCYISGESLQKGETVYAFRFFNGAYDIPSEFHYAKTAHFENNLKAKENLHKYKTNSYKLRDYAFKINYHHPLINHFWHTLEQFNLQNTLQLIASPPVSTTPYYAYKLDFTDFKQEPYKIEKQLNFGTGGSFINLLYVLIKCGYLDEIIELLPTLPEHFPYLLLLFNSKETHQKLDNYIEENPVELSNLIAVACKPYNKKSTDEVKKLAVYGKQNPIFLKKFSTCLNLYECHLYSNYHLGINWYYQDLYYFIRSRGSGLLDFFISNPDLIQTLSYMKKQNIYVDGISNGAIDAYSNSGPFLYRTILLHFAFLKDSRLEKWKVLPNKLNNITNFKNVHKHSITLLKKAFN